MLRRYSPNITMPRTWLAGALMIMSLASPTHVRGEDELRTWTDDTGEYEVLARWVSTNRARETVTLELSDGELVTLPLDRLSRSDRKYVEQAKSKPNATPAKVENSPTRTPKAKANTKTLYGIRWFDDLRAAGQAASGSKKTTSDDKPIFCFRVLGDLEGFM